MNQPTDRMLIDALCICLSDLYGLTNREDGTNAALYNKAREIIGAYTPMAIARIVREQDQLPSPEANPSRHIGSVIGTTFIEGTFDTEDEGIVRRLGVLESVPIGAEPVIKTDKEIQLAIGLGFQEVWPVTEVRGERQFHVWANLHKPTMPTLDRPGDEVVRHVQVGRYWTVHVVEKK